MKTKIVIILAILSLLNLCCSGVQVTGQNARKELNSAAESIRTDKSRIYKLDGRTVGEKGYFYAVRNNGTISYHPKKALVDSDFSRYPFIQRILKERNGCFSFNADGSWRYIFFTEIDSSEILCLTIGSSEFADTVDECSTDPGRK